MASIEHLFAAVLWMLTVPVLCSTRVVNSTDALGQALRDPSTTSVEIVSFLVLGPGWTPIQLNRSILITGASKSNGLDLSHGDSNPLSIR